MSYYITLNLIDCESCVQNSINLINRIKVEKADDLIVIICYKGKNKPDIINNILYSGLLIDSKSMFYKYNIHPLGASVIKTSAGKITAISDLTKAKLKEYKIILES